jgi:hypothetical protein
LVPGLALVFLVLAAHAAFGLIIPGVTVDHSHTKDGNIVYVKVTVSNDDNIGHTVEVEVTFEDGSTQRETVAVPGVSPGAKKSNTKQFRLRCPRSEKRNEHGVYPYYRATSVTIVDGL